MRYFIPAATIPLLVLVIISYAKWSVLSSEIGGYKALDWMSLLGLVLTYFGFLFSLFAAVKVKEISQLYFTKALLPSLTNQINEIVTYMSASATLSINQVDIDRKLHKIPAILQSIERAKGHNAGLAVKDARKTYVELRRWMDGSRQSTLTVGDSQSYWPLLSKLSEVAEFIKAFIEEEKAR